MIYVAIIGMGKRGNAGTPKTFIDYLFVECFDTGEVNRCLRRKY
jgi:hypothetical protein